MYTARGCGGKDESSERSGWWTWGSGCGMARHAVGRSCRPGYMHMLWVGLRADFSHVLASL
eukprot:scaffold100732_cov67-Phaeocystis_antarctica.AAC.1